VEDDWMVDRQVGPLKMPLIDRFTEWCLAQTHIVKSAGDLMGIIEKDNCTHRDLRQGNENFLLSSLI
jgi:hypothetical protein